MTGDDAVDPAVARLLEDPAVWAEVSADLRARTLAEALGTDAEAEDGAVVSRPDFGRPRPTGAGGGRQAWYRRPTGLVALGAAAALIVVAGVVGTLRLVAGGDEGKAVEVALAGTKDAPSATATAELRNEPSGISVELNVKGLPPAPAGTFYEAWLIDTDGKLGKVSAGTFHQRKPQDHVDLWLGVDPAPYEVISVTRQPVAGGSLAPGVVMLKGPLPGNL